MITSETGMTSKATTETEMTTIALAHDHYDAAHLAEVQAEMLTLGVPTIKAVWIECYNMYAALEGCHRIRAARNLGMTPIINAFDYAEVADMDCKAIGLDVDGDMTVAELIDGCHTRTQIEFA